MVNHTYAAVTGLPSQMTLVRLTAYTRAFVYSRKYYLTDPDIEKNKATKYDTKS